MEINRNVMIAVIVIAIAVLGGVGFMWMNSKPQPPANYQPIMPPSGYRGTASGQSAGYPGGGYPSGSPSGQPGQQPSGNSPGNAPSGSR